MPTFITPTNLRLTQGGVVNLDFLTVDNTARLTSSGIIGNGMAFSIGGGGGPSILPVIMNQYKQRRA